MIENIIYSDEPTIIQGLTSVEHFLILNVNNKNVGVPVYEFSSSIPEIDFLDLTKLDFKIPNATFYSEASSYNDMGLAVCVGGERCAFPLFKVDQESIVYEIKANKPTLVSGLTPQNRLSAENTDQQFIAIDISNQVFGIPIYDFDTVFPSSSTTPMSSVCVTTKLHIPVQNIRPYYTPSTNLNHKIKTYQDLINRIKYQLGAPFINLEVCEDVQMVDFIDKAIEWYTKYAGYTEEYLAFRSELYKEPGLQIDKLFSLTPAMREAFANGAKPSWDYDLDSYRRVIGLFDLQLGESTGINTLFTLEHAMAQQTYFSYMLGNVGFDLITWECLKQWLDLRTKLLAQAPHVDFNQRMQVLRIIPPPTSSSRYVGVIGAWVEKPVSELIMERWVEEYAAALTKIAIGNIRGKYQGTQLFGGGVINYNDLLSQGLKEKEELEKEILYGYGEVTPARFFLG